MPGHNYSTIIQSRDFSHPMPIHVCGPRGHAGGVLPGHAGHMPASAPGVWDLGVGPGCGTWVFDLMK